MGLLHGFGGFHNQLDAQVIARAPRQREVIIVAVAPLLSGVVGVVCGGGVPAGQHPLQFRGVGAAGNLTGPDCR